jgi:hypothetical protein
MALLCLSLIVVSAAFVACGDDDDDDGGGSEAERAEIADLAEALANTNGETATDEEIEFYLAHITDSFVQEFGTEDLAACEADAPTCIGEPLPNATVDPEKIEVDGDEGKAVIDSEIGAFGIDMVREDDVWKATGTYVPDDEIADGTEVVDVDLVDFAFEGDLESDAVKSGDFAFHFNNDGDQDHEAVLVALPDEGTIEELLQDESFQPEPIFVKAVYEPGEESDAALPAPLEPGRYGLVCFLPDTSDPEVSPDEATPHAFLGMTAEFTVE